MELTINGKTFPIEFAQDIEQGMMGRESLEGCMGFKLKKGFHSFWMKDCLIPLDIVFVTNDRVTKVFNNCQPCSGDDCEQYTSTGNMVFEFPAGTCDGWKPGDYANLYLGTKKNPV